MGKRSKKGGTAASIGRGQSMQLCRRMPRVPKVPPTLSAEAQRRLDAVEFSFKYSVRLAREAFKVPRATLYRWRKRYQPYRLTSLDHCSRAPKRKRPVSWTWEDEQ